MDLFEDNDNVPTLGEDDSDLWDGSDGWSDDPFDDFFDDDIDVWNDDMLLEDDEVGE
jgi:hypothetical protein